MNVPRQTSRASGSAPRQSPLYMDVDDRGSAVTLFSIAGPLGSVGGLTVSRRKTPRGRPKRTAPGRNEPVDEDFAVGGMSLAGCASSFEFHKTLRNSGSGFNLVFLRDPHNAFYHATPDGKPGGLDFYADTIRDLIASLGSTYNVALGCSMGGAAAIYFGARCNLSQVIAFSPIFPLVEFASPRSLARPFFNGRDLFRSPGGYATGIVLTYVARQLYRNAASFRDKAGVPSFTDAYFAGGNVPSTTIYYGEGCAMDRRHSLVLAGRPTVEYVPLHTWEHNTAGYLKRRGKLVDAILDPIEIRRPSGESETRRLARRRPR